MKNMTTIISFFLLISFSILNTACEKNSEKGYGYVLFYTNAQFLLNCGEFDVNIKIDGTKKGAINQAFLPINDVPLCEPNDTNRTVKIKLETGVYNYTADFYCSNNNHWNGNFNIEKDRCTIIFLDLNQIQN
jgi:hypothetical protein